jgi:hypothetical protein
MKWSIFNRRRVDVSNEVVEFNKKLKANDSKMAMSLRMDNANEKLH